MKGFILFIFKENRHQGYGSSPGGIRPWGQSPALRKEEEREWGKEKKRETEKIRKKRILLAQVCQSGIFDMIPS